MAGEKAPEKGQRKKRPPSRGPRTRVGNHGNGKRTQFKPGQNSHTGEVFRRGPDQIPRGSATLMLKVVALDGREDIYRNLRKYVKTPAGAFNFTREFADRTEGKPTQRHEVAPPRTTYFGPAPDPGDAPPPGPPVALAPARGPASPSNGAPGLPGPNGERFRPI
jgi:hypothetical protein